MLKGQMREMTAQTEAQASRVAVDVKQQLEIEMKAVATSTAVTSENITRATVDEVRRDVQAQIEHTRADAQRRETATHIRVEKIAADLSTLTEQLNRL